MSSRSCRRVEGKALSIFRSPTHFLEGVLRSQTFSSYGACLHVLSLQAGHTLLTLFVREDQYFRARPPLSSAFASLLLRFPKDFPSAAPSRSNTHAQQQQRERVFGFFLAKTPSWNPPRVRVRGSGGAARQPRVKGKLRTHDVSIKAASSSNNRATPPTPSLAVMEGIKTAAEGGDKVSQEALGLSYLKGHGVERNPELGVSWLRRAADQGCGRGQNILADCYATGVGVAKNVRRAVKHYRAAAAAGYPAAVTQMKLLTTCRACGAEKTHRVFGKCVCVSFCDAQYQSRCWPHPHRARCQAFVRAQEASGSGPRGNSTLVTWFRWRLKRTRRGKHMKQMLSTTWGTEIYLE
jgi:hypothetical protein